MKQRLLLILCLALLLAGCAANSPEAAPEPKTAAEAPAPTPEPTPEPAGYTAAESAAMGSYMCANRWLIDGDALYGLDYDEDLRPVLAAWRLTEDGLRFERILCADCVPAYLTTDGARLYYLNKGCLERLTLRTRKRETLHDGPLRSLQLCEGALYLTDGEGRFLRTDPDGKNPETLLEGPCGYAWVMPEGILYQSEDEGCCLRLRLWDGEDRRLTAAASYAPLRIDSTLWYAQKDREGSVLASVDLTDGTVTRYETPELRGTAELLRENGGWALRVFLAGDGWHQMILRPGETEGAACAYSGYRLCDGMSETLRVDAAYDPDGRLRCFVLADAAGGELRFFGGEPTE